MSIETDIGNFLGGHLKNDMLIIKLRGANVIKYTAHAVGMAFETQINAIYRNDRSVLRFIGYIIQDCFENAILDERKQELKMPLITILKNLRKQDDWFNPTS